MSIRRQVLARWRTLCQEIHRHSEDKRDATFKVIDNGIDDLNKSLPQASLMIGSLYVNTRKQLDHISSTDVLFDAHVRLHAHHAVIGALSAATSIGDFPTLLQRDRNHVCEQSLRIAYPADTQETYHYRRTHICTPPLTLVSWPCLDRHVLNGSIKQ